MRIVPDLIEPIIAFRSWNLEDIPELVFEGEPEMKISGTLYSFNQTPWKTCEPMRRECKLRSYLAELDYSKAYDCGFLETCRCGIYALKTKEDLLSSTYRRGTVRGEIYLWGKIHVGARGYRAEFAYPKSLELVVFDRKANKEDYELAKIIAKKYGVCCLVVQDSKENIPKYPSYTSQTKRSLIQRYPECKTLEQKQALAKELGIGSVSKLYNLASRLELTRKYPKN